MTELRRSFSDRFELGQYLASAFGDLRSADEELSPIRGGRGALDALLERVDPAAYAASRNRLDGAVTRLSPWIRHGVVTLAQVRDLALAAARRPDEAGRLVFELGWRDYWTRVHQRIGDGVWQDREPSRAGVPAAAYRTDLPDDIANGRTELVCIDAFVRELTSTGWLHNHARMWLAAYVVHWRRVSWQAGARWFLRHLLDGDLASNNLSWQWVAGTFSAKPYIFNRDNILRNAGDRFCAVCPHRDECPFDAEYADLAARLFPERDPERQDP